MAEGPQKCEDSSIGQDLLSVALGESGLNLDEFSSVSSESPGNLLNQALFESGIASGLDFWLAESNITTPVPSVPQYKVQTNYNNDSNINILSVSRENGSTGLTQQVITQSPEISLGGHQPVSLNSWTQKRGLHTANWNLTASDVLLQQQSQLQSSVRQILGLSAPPISQQNTSSPIRQELSKSVVSRLWSNQEVNLDKGAEGVPRKPVKEEVEEEEEEEEELGHTETYAEYMPSKSRIGIRHPDPVVETSSLSSVTPPDVWYNLHLRRISLIMVIYQRYS